MKSVLPLSRIFDIIHYRVCKLHIKSKQLLNLILDLTYYFRTYFKFLFLQKLLLEIIFINFSTVRVSCIYDQIFELIHILRIILRVHDVNSLKTQFPYFLMFSHSHEEVAIFNKKWFLSSPILKKSVLEHFRIELHSFFINLSYLLVESVLRHNRIQL